MKKILFSLIAVLATSFSGFCQISLSDAYSFLANQPGITENKAADVTLAPGVEIKGLKSVSGSMARYEEAFINAYESLPIDNMLIGVNNRKEMACSFTEPSDNGVYNVFFIVGEKGGKMTAAYGQTTAEGLQAIENCDVRLDGSELSMQVAPQFDVIELIEVLYAQN